MSGVWDFAAPVGAATLGGIAGRTAVVGAGLTAAGMVGSGAGIGAPAGPVGAAFGTLAGLAAWGVIKALLNNQPNLPPLPSYFLQTSTRCPAYHCWRHLYTVRNGNDELSRPFCLEHDHTDMRCPAPGCWRHMYILVNEASEPSNPVCFEHWKAVEE